MKRFKIWKTITIEKKPKLDGINVSFYAQDMLDKISWGKKETISLVKIQVKDLGFNEYVTTTELFAKAKKLGLDLCPPQVVPQLREDFINQSLDEWLYIGMEAITGRDGSPLVFSLERDGDGLWLHDSWAGPDDRWFPGTGFVFSLRKSLKSLKPLKKKSFDPLASLTLEKRVKALEKKMKKIERIIKL